MDINLIEDMKFKKYKDDIESYFKTMCRGDSFYSHKCMDAIDIYVYRALKPFICANKLSKEKYFNNSIKKKNYRNILIHIMKYIQCPNNKYIVHYPEMFDDRNKLKFDEALVVINKITKQYVDLINNISSRKGDIKFLKKFSSILNKLNLFEFFKLDFNLRNNLLLMSKDQYYGLDFNIYNSLEKYFLLAGISCNDFMFNNGLRIKYRNVFYERKSIVERAQLYSISNEIILTDLFINTDLYVSMNLDSNFVKFLLNNNIECVEKEKSLDEIKEKIGKVLDDFLECDLDFYINNTINEYESLCEA